MITLERLREVLHYEPTTGVFRWIKKPSLKGKVKIGSVAGTVGERGRVIITIDYGKYRAHRLAVLYMTGAWPQGDVDHKKTRSNAWHNLRDVTRSVNMQNRCSPQSNNTTGFLGVSRAGTKFRARIKYEGRQHHLGRFDTPELAYAAYVAVKRKKHDGNTI